MKKQLKLMIVAGVIFALSTGIVFADVKSQTINLVIGQSTAQVNGKNITMAAPAHVVGGRTLVPLRFISEAFGCEVKWEGATKTAIVYLENYQIDVPIGQYSVITNGIEETIEVPAQIIDGNTYVPLRLISENLGAKVDYNADTKNISIVMNTYRNTSSAFEAVIPDGWKVIEENAAGVDLIGPENYVLSIIQLDTSQVVSASTFKEVAGKVFDAYSIKEDFSSTNETDGLAYASYQEQGNQFFLTLRLLDNGNLYACLMAHALGNEDAAIYKQSDLIDNTLRAYWAQ